MRSLAILAALFLGFAANTAAQACPASALSCFELVPAPDFGDVVAYLELQHIPSANGFTVTRDGRTRYRLITVIDSLPAPARFGATAYVAWATTLSMDSTVRLGTVRAGRTDLGEIGFEQFRVLISAEADPTTRQRTGKFVLRGTSPSTRLMAHRDLTIAGPLGAGGSSSSTTGHRHTTWPMPPMDPRQPPMAGMDGLEPNVAPYLPQPRDTAALPLAVPRKLMRVQHGDTISLTAGMVRRRIAGKTFVMFGFNGQYPGPLIEVSQRATIYVDFRNQLDQPSTIHWHGVRLQNRFDGVPHLTQDPVEPGGRFLYRIDFPDAGIYWYHPHHREDIQQDLGLYGNLMVQPAKPTYYSPANASEVLMLDDLLVGDEGLIPFGQEAETHALMGRFGNLLLMNGEPSYALRVGQRSVVRFFLTNVSNTRVFNISFDGARMKLVGSDVGRFEREEWVQSVVISPAERYIVDVLFEDARPHTITNRVRALNHVTGTYYAEIDTLGAVTVQGRAATDHRASFNRLRVHDEVVREIGSFAPHFDRAPDRELVLSMRTRNLPPVIAAMAAGFPVPVDWNDVMGMMNWATTGKQVTWIVRDARTGQENMDLNWTFRRGELVRLRIFNDPAVFHAMSHPIHVHGQRMLVLSRNGVANTNRVWKDTALIQAGETVELLVEMSNPGKWMLHCHIAEHLGTGMMMTFSVL